MRNGDDKYCPPIWSEAVLIATRSAPLILTQRIHTKKKKTLIVQRKIINGDVLLATKISLILID
jgi:hypothetical protein